MSDLFYFIETDEVLLFFSVFAVVLSLWVFHFDDNEQR